MKIQEAIEIRNSRKNVMAFLHRSDISTIEKLLGQDLNRPVIWNDLCDQVLEAYRNNKIKNKQLSEIFELLMQSNSQLRTEKYRYSNNSLYKYDAEQRAYIHCKPCSRKDFNLHYANIYID
ncbi:hypothetical protein [Acinetobacter genomosp. 15BJ]|uniref:Uncharacterized protein n=1 Tax=Acinetobacter genomosp. 15BJ TaxID=106651 RepID=A0ABT8UZ92_9GAMM|nr:hypothetical protein [Acinetobacter genomosp. 15BJ]MDO3658374.1 hypothetical protein [Acinetobacter genomosp. 15BJ]